jgi:hypothetical protein
MTQQSLYPWGIVGYGDDTWAAMNMITGEMYWRQRSAAGALADAERLAEEDAAGLWDGQGIGPAELSGMDAETYADLDDAILGRTIKSDRFIDMTVREALSEIRDNLPTTTVEEDLACYARGLASVSGCGGFAIFM